jgi:hypothetical protein
MGFVLFYVEVVERNHSQEADETYILALNTKKK